MREQLISLGLYKGNGRETLRGYVAMPVVDEAGQTIAIRGYKLDPGTDGPAIILVGADDVEEANPLIVNAPILNAPTPDELVALKPSTIEDLTIDNGKLLFTRDDRHYRIRGLEKNTSTCTLRVNLMASRDSLVHLDSLDLVKARSRASYIKAAATELFVDEDIVKKDIGQLLLKLEQLQASRIVELKAPASAPITISDEDRETALLLRQHQRTIHTQEIDGEILQYINVTVDDIAVAGRLATELLGQSLDELSPQTRRFLNRLSRYVSETATETRVSRDSVRFTRRDIRQRLGWSDFQMRMHLTKLVELEYVLQHRGKNGQRYVYELLYDGGLPQSQPHFSGLIDPQVLSESTGKSVVMTPTLSIAEATLSIP